MIKIILSILASLETRIIDLKKEKGRTIENIKGKKKPKDYKKEYNKLLGVYKQPRKELSKQAKQPMSFGDKIKAQVKGVSGKVRNAVDMTAFYFGSKWDNHKSTKEVKKNPDKPIAYIQQGVMQTRSSARRKAKALRAEGYAPIHLKTFHNIHDDETKYQKLVSQVKKVHKKAKIKKPENRYDGIMGHSSGGNDVCYAANKKQTAKLGIKFGQAASHDYYGMPIKNLEQKMVVGGVKYLGVKLDDVGNSKYARKKSINRMKEGKPEISLECVAGKEDNLVPAEYSFHKFADKHHVIDGDHWDLSGASKKASSDQAYLFAQQGKRVRKQYEGKKGGKK